MAGEKTKRRGKYILLLCIVLLVMLLGAAAILIYFFVPVAFNGGIDFTAPQALDADTTLAQDAVAADREQMIAYVEHIHPYFLEEGDTVGYGAAKQQYIDRTGGAMTVGEFQAATGEFLSTLSDGHTGLAWSEQGWLYVPWQYRDGKLFLTYEGDTDEVWVTEIGGVAMEEVLTLIDRLFPAENAAARRKNAEQRADGENLLRLAGAEIRNGAVIVETSDGKTAEYHFIPGQSSEEVANTWAWEDDIFLVDFNVCNDDENLKQIAHALKRAVADGCSKVILDARGNGGGNSNACKRLLAAMGMKPPEYDMLVRFSEEAAAQNGYLRKSGSVRCNGSSVTKPNKAVDLVVLADSDTFSSAAMLMVWVRDGGLGTIVGEPSTNKPNHYGDIIYFSLTHSHLWGTIAHKRFIRPDEDRDETMLMPDIVTSGEDAFDAAVAFLHRQSDERPPV